MTYARSRLWLGISGVGLIVLLTGFALYFDLPHRLLSGLSSPAAISFTLLTYVCVSIPGDLLGGFLLPRRHQRSELALGSFLTAWLRGVLSQFIVLAVCAALLLQAGKWGGTRAEIACFILILLLLIVAQSYVAQLVARLQPAPELLAESSALMTRPVKVFRTSDPGFVGGWVGVPTAERLILPDAWRQNLTPELFVTELTRRSGALATGARNRGLLIALVWNILGFSIACNMPGALPGNAPGLIQTALWFTLWSFLGLLTLPSLNRPAVFELDRYAVTQGISGQVVAATISRLDSLQDDEPERTKWIERVFHPIPSVKARIAALGNKPSRIGGWQCARMTLYLSWGCFGFLSRAVHCNAGRPALWVLFPGD